MPDDAAEADPQPWSPEAATEPVPPLAPPPTQPTAARSDQSLPTTGATRPPRSTLRLALVVAVMAAAAVAVIGLAFITVLDRIQHASTPDTSAPAIATSEIATPGSGQPGTSPSNSRAAPPPTVPPFHLLAIRTVDAVGADKAVTAPTRNRFPATTTVIYVDVRYRSAAHVNAVGLTVTATTTTAAVPPSVVLQNTYVLGSTAPGGDGGSSVPIIAPGGVFAPGHYTIVAGYAGGTIGTTEFDVTP